MARRNKNTRPKRGRSFGRPSRQALTSMTANGKLADPRPIRTMIKPLTTTLSWPGPDIATSTSGASGGIILLKSSDFPSTSFGAYSTIFDQFKIVQWSVMFMAPNPVIGVSASNVNLGLFHTAIDFDDTTPPTSASQLETYSTYRFDRHPKTVKRVVQAQYQVFNGGSASYFIRPQWIQVGGAFDLSGVKWVHDQVVGITNGQVLYKTTISAVFKFRLSK